MYDIDSINEQINSIKYKTVINILVKGRSKSLKQWKNSESRLFCFVGSDHFDI